MASRFHEQANDDAIVSENSDSDVRSGDSMDWFLTMHGNDIIDICYDLQERFAFNPYFLSKMTVALLTDFCMSFSRCSIVSDQQFVPTLSPSKIELFETMYQKEINVSYHLVASFVKKAFKVSVPCESWADFCICSSDLSELKWSRLIVVSEEDHEVH
jgi:hypothetical protein